MFEKAFRVQSRMHRHKELVPRKKIICFFYSGFVEGNVSSLGKIASFVVGTQNNFCSKLEKTLSKNGEKLETGLKKQL